MDFRAFEYLTFDCYGTLIDWETGLLRSLRSIFVRHGVSVGDDEILSAYAELESAAEAGPYRRYREILEDIVEQLGIQFGFAPNEVERRSLPESVAGWLPFDDTVPALKKLSKRFQLGVISNIDDDLFADTARLLEVEFDGVVTAEQVRAYKPSCRNFEVAQERMGLRRDKWLHVAQSRAHDILPTREMGISNVWVNRHFGRSAGAVLPVEVEPDFVVKDLSELVSVLL